MLSGFLARSSQSCTYKGKEALSFASKEEPIFLQKKNNLFGRSGPVLNHCHREGREEYDRASCAWTFSEGDCNLTRPEEDGDDIDEDKPLVLYLQYHYDLYLFNHFEDVRQFCLDGIQASQENIKFLFCE